MIYLSIAAGGVLGALARYLVSVWLAGATGSGFPWATLLINLAGSILLGFLLRSFPTWSSPPDARAFLTVGFCGSFTTFSTFGYETVSLLQARAFGVAVAYAGGSFAVGLLAVVLGLAAGGRLR